MGSQRVGHDWVTELTDWLTSGPSELVMLNEPGSRPSPHIEPTHTLFLDSVVTRTVRYKFLIFISYSIYDILLYQISWTKTVFKNFRCVKLWYYKINKVIKLSLCSRPLGSVRSIWPKLHLLWSEVRHNLDSNPKEGRCQRMFKLPHNCTHCTCQQGYAKNPS